MTRFYCFIFFLFSLGAETCEGGFGVCIEQNICICLTVGTMSYGFSAQDIIDNATQEISMGTFTVTLDNNAVITTNNDVLITSFAYNGSTIELAPKATSTTLDFKDTRLELTITDNRDSAGDLNTTTLVQGSIIRRREVGGAAIVDEAHVITVKVKIGQLNSSNAGVYNNHIYFIFES